MRNIALICLTVLAGVFTSATICAPEVLGSNPFLVSFVGAEFVSVLIVIVTVSLVSVTQIHLEYSRIERAFKLRVFGDARREVNLAAILLVVFLFLGIILAMIKSAYTDEAVLQSTFHSIGLMILASAILVMYDLVRTVYVLAAEEPITGDDEDEENSQ